MQTAYNSGYSVSRESQVAIEIPFNKEPEFTHGIADNLSPLVRRVIANNPGPFTYTGTGTYVIGTGKVAVIDPGPADTTHIEAILAAVEGETISHILVTHTHIDHSPGCRLLQKKCDAQTWAYGSHGLGKPRNDAEFGADYDFKPDVIVTDGQTIEGADWSLRCVHTPGHAANHLSFWLKQENALFCGDAVMGWSTTIVSPPDGNMKDYMDTLALLKARDDKIFYPTHGSPVTNPQEYLKALYQHRVEREEQALACIARGVDTIADMVPIIYSELDTAMHPAAAMSLFATVECLALQGRLTADSITPTARYKISP